MENSPAGRAGKTGKYLKYAIGEVILVVIGILIAIQINTWNTHKKNSIEATVIKKALIVDMRKIVFN